MQLALVATFKTSKSDNKDPGWRYPGTINYRKDTMQSLAEDAGFKFQLLDWNHSQQWALFSAPGFVVASEHKV